MVVVLNQLNEILSRGIEPIRDVFKEASVKPVTESPIGESREIINNRSLESLKAQNELTAEKITIGKIEQIERNREEGANREKKAYKELQREYPEELGYKTEGEQYLRNKEGNILKDPETGEGRRVDFVVYKGGEVVKSIEVTSETAPKDAQIAKENRIRGAGGNFIKDRDTGQLIEIPQHVQTEVKRYA